MPTLTSQRLSEKCAEFSRIAQAQLAQEGGSAWMTAIKSAGWPRATRPFGYSNGGTDTYTRRFRSRFSEFLSLCIYHRQHNILTMKNLSTWRKPCPHHL